MKSLSEIFANASITATHYAGSNNEVFLRQHTFASILNVIVMNRARELNLADQATHIVNDLLGASDMRNLVSVSFSNTKAQNQARLHDAAAVFAVMEVEARLRSAVKTVREHLYDSVVGFVEEDAEVLVDQLLERFHIVRRAN